MNRVKNIHTWPGRAANTLHFILSKNTIVVRYPSRGLVRDNWGDKLNPVLIELLSNKKVISRLDILPGASRTTYVCIGSSLGSTRKNEVVWGHGFMSHEVSVKDRAREFLAVRGPLSYEKLRHAGKYCPPVFGDPALLVPKFFSPAPSKTYDLGIVRQFHHQHCKLRGVEGFRGSVLNVNIRGGIREVISAITSCRIVLSSSLHGIICAHAYGVPAAWVHFADGKPLDYYKFRDYFESVGIQGSVPITMTTVRDIDQAVATSVAPNVDARVADLENSCPFN